MAFEWNVEKERVLLEQIARVRNRRGNYRTVSDWSAGWRSMHRFLSYTPGFEGLTMRDLVSKVNDFSFSDVDTGAAHPPEEPMQRLIYEAFKETMLPPPSMRDAPRSSVPRTRRRRTAPAPAPAPVPAPVPASSAASAAASAPSPPSASSTSGFPG